MTATLTDDLGWTLGVVFRAYIKAATAATAELPGGHRGFQVLTAAIEEPSNSQSALGQQLGIDRTVMTYLLDDMQKAGLIERKPCPTDRRTRHIIATDHGRGVLRECGHRLRLAESHILAGLPDTEQEVLKGLLQKLAVAINEFDPVASPCEVIQDIAAS